MGSNPFRTQSKICEAQVACDSGYVLRKDPSATICAACAKALAKKNKPPKPLKGVKLYPEDEDV